MKPLGDENDHFWKVQRMARATDVDLAQAYAGGELTESQWVETVQRCRSCDWLEGCARFLDRNDTGGAQPPDACINHKLFEALKP